MPRILSLFRGTGVCSFFYICAFVPFCVICRGGPLWPPQRGVLRWGGHRGPPLQLFLARSKFPSAVHVKIFVVWIDGGGHLQVMIGLAVWTESLVNQAGQAKQARVFHA